MSCHRHAIEHAIRRYIAMLGGECPASARNQRRPREEAAAYGLGMCRALAAIEEIDGAGHSVSVALAADVVRAARGAKSPVAPRQSVARIPTRRARGALTK